VFVWGPLLPSDVVELNVPTHFGEKFFDLNSHFESKRKMVLLCRHGIKQFENGKIIDGKYHVDAGLTDGNDIRRQKPFLSGVRRIVSSPFLRCRQTAEIISDGKIPIEIDNDLREFIPWYGPSEMGPIVETTTLELLNGAQIAETRRDFRDRVHRVIQKPGYFDDDVLIVSHARVLKKLAKKVFSKSVSFEMGMVVSLLFDPGLDLITKLVLDDDEWDLIGVQEQIFPNLSELPYSEKQQILEKQNFFDPTLKGLLLQEMDPEFPDSFAASTGPIGPSVLPDIVTEPLSSLAPEQIAQIEAFLAENADSNDDDDQDGDSPEDNSVEDGSEASSSASDPK
jgi:broad specificity phosphatase PhoE